MIKILSKAFYFLKKIDNRVCISFFGTKDSYGLELCTKPYFIVAFDFKNKIFMDCKTKIIKNVTIKKIIDSYFIVKTWLQSSYEKVY